VASIWRTWGAAAQATAGSAVVVTAADGQGASPKVSTLHPLPLIMLLVAASSLALGSCCESDPLHGLGSCAGATAAMKEW
jgi:drug/metabolite transporter (DMT)-like permease